MINLWMALLTARHHVALMRAGARFEKGELVTVFGRIGGGVEQAVPNKP